MTHSLFLLAAFFEGDGVAGIFNSPFVVPVAGTVMILGIVVAGIWSGVRTREMQSQERLAAIAKGIALEPTLDQTLLRQATAHIPLATVSRAPNDGAGARRVGIVLASTGVGLAAFFWALAIVLHERDVLCGAATGIIPLAIGVGFLIDAGLRRAEFQRLSETARGNEAPRGNEPLRTPSQGSELRPLH